jgi:hypothetical protein
MKNRKRLVAAAGWPSISRQASLTKRCLFSWTLDHLRMDRVNLSQVMWNQCSADPTHLPKIQHTRAQRSSAWFRSRDAELVHCINCWILIQVNITWIRPLCGMMDSNSSITHDCPPVKRTGDRSGVIPVIARRSSLGGLPKPSFQRAPSPLVLVLSTVCAV